VPGLPARVSQLALGRQAPRREEQVGIDNHTWLRLLGVAALAWLALQVFPVAWAAEPEFEFLPSSGVVGEDVTLVGSGWFVRGGDVEIFLPGADTATAEPWAVAQVLESGAFNTSASVPPLPAGEHSFLACQGCDFDGVDAVPNARGTFDVEQQGSVGAPDLRLGQQEGPPDTVVTVTGSGWTVVGEDVHLFVSRAESLDEAKQLVSMTPDRDGTIGSGWTFKVPTRPPATYTFYACQVCSKGDGALSYEVSFRVTSAKVEPTDPPTLDLTPETAAVGDSVTAEGFGWLDGAGPASVYAREADLQTGEAPLATATVTGGAFAAPITVPETEAGSLTIFACQKCGSNDLEAIHLLDIEATGQQDAVLHVVPGTGSPGREVRVTGTGWREGEVRLFARHRNVRDGVPLGRAQVEDGAFGRTVTVPAMEAGPIEILGCQQCGRQDARVDTDDFTVLAAPLDRPALDVDPRSAHSGDTVTLSGAGWPAAAGEVTIYIRSAGDGDRIVWLRVRPGRDNAFSVDVAAPQRDPGDYRLVACQQCGEAPAGPRATRAFEIEGDSVLRSAGTGLGVALLVAALAVGLLIRGGRGRPRRTSTSDHPSDPPPADGLRITGVEDANSEVVVYATTPSHGAGVELPRLDVSARPDPSRLSDQIEVWP
jgi:hypothetical protein